MAVEPVQLDNNVTEVEPADEFHVLGSTDGLDFKT